MSRHLLLIITLSLIALWPFFKKGFFITDDGEWMVIRFSAFHQTLADGQFPVRFVDRLNNNYGYPVLNFLYPLPFYLATIPKLAGFGFVDSIKIVFMGSTILSVVAMYWALSQIFSKWSSFAGAILYLFAPYRFVDLYHRGSLGESVAFAFLPLIMGSIFKIKKGRIFYFPLLSMFLAFLILSHNVLGILFTPIFLAISFILANKEKIKILIAFLLAILIATFFWLPAIFDIRYVNLSQIKVADVSDYLIAASDLVVGPLQATDQLPISLGIVSIAVFLGAVYLRFTIKTKNWFLDFLLVIYLSSLVLMTKASLPFWQKVPGVDVIQFPWRLLSLTVFVTAILTSYVIDTNRQKFILAILIILAAIFSSFVYTKPANFVDRGDGFYATNEDSTTVQDEYLPLWVEEKPASRANQKIQVAQGEAQIESQQINYAYYKVFINAQNETKIKVNTIYFPEWTVLANDQRLPIDYQNKHGLINFQLPKGNHEVIIKYTRSSIHLVSEIISLVSVAIVGIILFLLWRKQNSYEQD